MTDEQPVAEDKRRSLFAGAALLALLLALGFVMWLRRNPDYLDRLYDRGNLLGSANATDFTALSFGRACGTVEIIVIAGLVAACAIFVRKRQTLVAAVGTAVVFGVVFLDSIARWTMTVAGHFYLFMCDDALISMRYARNFGEGRGLVYNAGEYVDGFSNPLWTWLMAIPFALHMHEGIAPIPITLLGGVLLCAGALLARATVARLGAPIAVQVLCAFAVAFDGSSFEFATLGLETPLLTFGTSLFFFGAVSQRRWPILTAITILTLARADGAITAAALLGWLVLEEWKTTGDSVMAVVKRQWRFFAVLFVVAAALVLWRLALYGYPAPNTAYLKVYPIAVRLPIGLAYGVRVVMLYGPALLFVLGWARGTALGARARRLVVPFVAIALYSVYVGGDTFAFVRFLGPLTPALWMAVALTAMAGWQGRSATTNAFAFAALLLLVPMRVERGVIGLTWDHSSWMDQNLVAAKTIERNVPPASTVGIFFAGVSYYAPNHKFIDLLGKAESHIAHEDTVHGGIPGHNKFDFQYVYNVLKPDVTFTSFSCDQVEAFMKEPPEVKEQALNPGRDYLFRPAAAQVLDPTFLALYASHRVVLRENGGPAGHPIGCWFIREGSPVPVTWEIARQ